MRTLKAKTPNGYTVFCDDIRREDSGKLILVGMYMGSLIVQGTLPTTLPKFAFLVTYRERPGESSDPVKIRIFFPGSDEGAPDVEFDLPMEQFRNMPRDPELTLDDPLLTATLTCMVSPLELKQKGQIRVRAYRGNHKIKLGALLVKENPPKAAGITEPT